MIIRTRTQTLTKRFPLTISRGTSAASENLFVEIEHDGVVGLGEMSPFGLGGDASADVTTALASIESWRTGLEPISPFEMQAAEQVFTERGGLRAAWAAIDFAMHDWVGKQVEQPVYRTLGLSADVIAQTTLTVGIMPPNQAAERASLWMKEGAKRLKIKLGSSEGIAADQQSLEAIRLAVGSSVSLQVDANGGWSLANAKVMMRWLADRGVEYVEQPLARGCEDQLTDLFRDRPLPMFADESCLTSADVPGLAHCVDGINLKLMKAGGIREGLRVIHTARAHGLQVMMGCMSESSLAIAGSVHLSSLADYLDLDSHLNLAPDPYTGLAFEEGRVLPSNSPGLGVIPRNGLSCG